MKETTQKQKEIISMKEQLRKIKKNDQIDHEHQKLVKELEAGTFRGSVKRGLKNLWDRL